MSKLPLMPSRLMIAVCSAALLTSCGLPSPIPAGYTYHHQTYKSPPGPEAEDVGYDFSVAANHKAVQAWRDIASDLLAKLESGYVFQGRDVTVIPPLGVDQMNKSLDYALHDAFVGKGYKLRAYAKDVPGVAVTMHPLIGDEKAAYEKDRKDYAASHGFKPEDVMGVSILLEVREGAKLVHQTRGVYSIPNFGYDPEFNRQHEYRLMPVAGKAPFRAEPELRPAPIRPAAPVPPMMLGSDKMAGGHQGSIETDKLTAPQPVDDENKPLDLQGYND